MNFTTRTLVVWLLTVILSAAAVRAAEAQAPAPPPPAQEPPLQTPLPAQEPPSTQPPAQAPPSTQPPAQAPPLQTPPPLQAPPSTQPPAQEPPSTPPPSQTPPSSDQPAPEQVRRPYRGIFRGPSDPSRQALAFTGSVFGAYDDDVFAGSSGATVTAPGARGRSGWYGGLVAGLEYSRPGNRVSVGLTGDLGVNGYASRSETAPTARTAGNVDWKLARHTTVDAAGSVVYAPEYRLGVFINPGSLTGSLDPFGSVVPDYDLFSLAAYRTSASVVLSQGIGRRASLDGYYTSVAVNYVEEPNDYRTQVVGGRFTDRITQNLSLRLGYGYSVARYDALQGFPPQRVHNIDAGFDYGRALSVSRRTRLSFSTGSAILARGQTLSNLGQNDYSYRFTGAADLTHEMGRTWKAQLGYRRGIDFREGFYDPFLYDSVTGNVGGLWSRRVRFSSSADYSVGTVGVGSSNKFNAASANAGLEYALSRSLALFARYVYYAYEFDAQVALNPRFGRTLDRQGVRIGLTAFVPVIR